MNKYVKAFSWILIIYFTLGFRVFTGHWGISKTDPTIWIKMCESDYTIEENDLKEGDPLAGVRDLTFDQVLQSIIDDYNSVPTSYLRLAIYPADPDDPGTPATGDSAFTFEKAKTRTIDICFGDTNPAAGVGGGYAQSKFDDDRLIGCQITAKKEFLKKALFLTHLLTHEMGHCFGLAHPQEGTKSVMSYFGEKHTRLQIDDFAGLTFKFPMEDSYAKEVNTLGLTGCSPR